MTMNVPEPKLKDKTWQCYKWHPQAWATDRLLPIGEVSAPTHGDAIAEATNRWGAQGFDYIDPLTTREIETGKKGYKLQPIEGTR